MKIAIMADSHDHWPNLTKAINIANDAGCEVLLFAGDLISPPGISVLSQFSGSVKLVWGNNEAERVGILTKIVSTKNVELCGDFYEGTLDDVRVFMNHYPRFAELAAKSGEFDVCIHGHTHNFRQEQVGKTVLVNPGEIQGSKTGKLSFVIYNTQDKYVKKIEINLTGDLNA